MKKIALISACVLLSAVAVYSAVNAQKAGKPVDKASGPNGAAGAVQDGAGQKGPDQKVYAFTIDGKSTKGVQEWHLEGKTARIFGSVIHLEDLSAKAFGEGFTIDLTSREGVYDKEKAEVELIGGVNVVSQDGSVLTTERARWSQSTKDITTDCFLDIKQEKINAAGTGGKANSSTRTATLLKDITVHLEPDTVVTCDGPLDMDFQNNNAVFRNNVHVVDKDGQLFSDLLTVNFDPETKKIAEVVAENNVRLKRGKSYTICEKATYTDGTRSVQFVGRPRVVIDPQEMEQYGSFSGKWPSQTGGE